MTDPRGFLIYPNAIEEVDDEGQCWAYAGDPDLYDRLVLAGYPLHSDTYATSLDAAVDVSVQDSTVTAYGTAPGGSTVMPPAEAELFLAWFRVNAEEKSC